MSEIDTIFDSELLEKHFFLNPHFILRNDINRVILTASGSMNFDIIGRPNISTFIHPIHAMMLSFFVGDKTLKDNLADIADFFDISVKDSFYLVYKFLANEKRVVIEYANTFFYFPPKVLIEYDNNLPYRTYSASDFNLNTTLDFDTTRFNIPIEASILLNNRCVTNCVYCYADKRQIYDCKIPFSRLVEIIDETKKLGFRNVDIQGGELFLYEHWHELLKVMFKADYSIYISTKYPLSYKQIIQLKELGVKEIQVSLDSIFIDDLKLNLKVNNNYLSKILTTIKLLNDYNFRIKLKPVISSFNFNIKRMEDYINYFKQFKNICIVEFTAPAHSNFKSQKEFFEYRLSKKNAKEIEDFVLQNKDNYHFKLRADVAVKDKYSLINQPLDIKKDAFTKRSRCTGNQSSLLILPSGDITLCEKAYFNSNLIIGNILENSIIDVWNSKRAKDLFYISQSIFPQESPCANCAEFEECRHNLGVCWLDVMASYGEEKWLYPSPDCPYAPQPKYITYYE